MATVEIDIDLDDIASIVAEQIDTETIARRVAEDIDAGDIAEHFDASDIAYSLDAEEIAEYVTVDADDVARDVDISELAGEIDLAALAEELATVLLGRIRSSLPDVAQAVMDDEKKESGADDLALLLKYATAGTKVRPVEAHDGRLGDMTRAER